MAEVTSRKSAVSLAWALLLVALLAAYANHFQNSFHLDDAHTIENNMAIRELRNIPLFFRDATRRPLVPSPATNPTDHSYRRCSRSTINSPADWGHSGFISRFSHSSFF